MTEHLQIENEIGRTGGPFKNKRRKKWVNHRVVFIKNHVRKGGDWVMTGRVYQWKSG